MSEKILSYAAVMLLFSSFSYVATDERLSEPTGLSTVLIVARVLPIAAVILICLLATPVRRYVDLIKTVGTPPFLFWTWYASVAAVSGFVSGVSPTWSAWKCTELLVVVLWGASVTLHIQRTGETRILDRIFSLLVASCFVISLWSIAEMFREGNSLADYVMLRRRLDTTWPHINSITLSVISLFAICGGVLVTSRMMLPMRVAFALPLLAVFLLSRSRTGLLALIALAVFAFATNTISRGKKTTLIMICLVFVAVLVGSSALREWMRIDSWSELARGAGRIRTIDGRSGWGETIQIIKKSPEIGVGYVIVRRFLDSDHAAVDNFVLQSLVVAGVIGALPMILYSSFIFFRWLLRVRFLDPESRRVGEMGMLATCLGFIKSFTTNGISALDFSLIIFLFGAISLQYVLSRKPPEVAEPEPELLAVGQE